MPRVPRSRVRKTLSIADVCPAGRPAAEHNRQRGLVLEEVVCDVFGRVPGVEVAFRNVVNVSGTQEVDILFWNRRSPDGFYHLETPFLVECKNWTDPVPAREITLFSSRLETRACRDGILIASHGITGKPGTLSEAYYEISVALAKGRRILVIDRKELESFDHTDQIVDLLKVKILDLTKLSTLR